MRGLITGLSVLAAANMAFAQAETTTAVGGKTTAKVEEVKAEKKKWGVLLLQDNYINSREANTRNFKANQDNTNNEITGVQADAIIGLSYSLSDTKSVAARLNFLVNQTQADRTAEYDMYDPAIIYKDKAAYKVKNTPIVQEFRFYVPADEVSRINGQHQTRWGLSFDQALNKNVTMAYANTVRGYFYTKRSDGLDSMRNYTSATANFDIGSEIFKPYVELGHIARFRRSGTGFRGVGQSGSFSNPDDNANTASWEVGANITAGPVEVQISVNQEHDLRSGNEFNMLDDSSTNYGLTLTAVL